MKLLEYNPRHIPRHDVAKGFEDASPKHRHEHRHGVYVGNRTEVADELGHEVGHSVQVE